MINYKPRGEVMRVSVIGTGYVGLVTGACLAYAGHEVLCIDNNAAKVAQMQLGQSPIYEPGLEAIMQTSIQAGRLSFTTDLGQGVDHGTILFIAVGTPALPNGESDTQAVEAVASGIGQYLKAVYKVIVNKSTVPIGSGDWVHNLILATAPAQAQFDVVSNPEFLREGSAVFDIFNPDRIILGSRSVRAVALMQDLYAPIVQRDVPQAVDQETPIPVIVADLESAEMIKYAANAFLATKISFINEIANICERVGADVTQVAQGIGLDSRIGPQFLRAGLGWGGSCFPKDISALVHTAQDYGYEAQLLKATVAINQQQRYWVLNKLQQVLKILKGKTIGLLGLTFKPDTDDLRDAPALALIDQLQRLGAKVRAFDPIIMGPKIHPLLAQVELASDPYQLSIGCDALVLVTEWPIFQTLDYNIIAQSMNRAILIDGRNVLDQETLVAAGFLAIGIGKSIQPSTIRSTPMPMTTGRVLTVA